MLNQRELKPGKAASAAMPYQFEPGPLSAIDALLLDARMPGTRRYLRRPYRDPLTNSDQWGLVLAPQGGIMGVYRMAMGTPIKQANFSVTLTGFENKTSYADWKFTYLPM